MTAQSRPGPSEVIESSPANAPAARSAARQDRRGNEPERARRRHQRPAKGQRRARRARRMPSRLAPLLHSRAGSRFGTGYTMLNAKTVMTVYGISPVLFFGALLAMWPGRPVPLLLIGVFCFLLAFLLATVGMVLNLMIVFKRGVRVRCGSCNASSPVVLPPRKGALYYRCPSCGFCRARPRFMRTAAVERMPLESPPPPRE
jgi:hypothetical protein